MVSSQIFRAYDIRGIYQETLTEESVAFIGQALGTIAQERGEKAVLVARDGRLSGPVLLNALKCGVLNSGCNVVDIGSVPTPVLYFATHISGVKSGLMLTGSHNPSNYNGIKIVIGGQSFFGDDIQLIYQTVKNKKFKTGNGCETVRDDMLERYIARIVNDVKLARPLKIAIDCGNGIAGCVATQLFKRLHCDVTELYCDVDGHFPNHHPDPSKAENLQELIQTVKNKKLDIGLAFDGDADRLGAVTSAGDVVWPDRQMILFARDILSRHPKTTIIYDVKCTTHLKKAIEAADGKAMMSRTGHSYLKAALQREKNALLAGEMSGHFFFKERWYGFDDGLYAGARLLEILSRDPRQSHAVFNNIPNSINTPELQCAITEENKFSFMDRLLKTAVFHHGDICTIDGLRVDFSDGWGLVRASNTTPCLVMRFEADSQLALLRIKNEFKRAISAVDHTLQLPF